MKKASSPKITAAMKQFKLLSKEDQKDAVESIMTNAFQEYAAHLRKIADVLDVLMATSLQGLPGAILKDQHMVEWLPQALQFVKEWKAENEVKAV